MTRRWPTGLLASIVGALFILACSSSTTTEEAKTDAAACEDYSGTWEIDGCLVKECVIAQSVCDVTFNCKSVLNTPFTSTGTAVGKAVSFESSELQCELATAGKGLTGTCTSEAGVCSLTGTRL